MPDRSEALMAESDKSAQPTKDDSQPRWNERAAIFLRPWLGWIVAAWSIGVVLCSLRPLFGWHTLRRLKRVGVSPASEPLLAAIRRVSERLRCRRAVSVLQSTLAQVPVVVGYFRPVILLPISLLTSLPAEQLEAVLAHELAHVRRHDFVVNLLQTLVETLFFYHPAVWWLSHQIRIEREHCCDDLVARVLNNRVEYGRALLAIEELRGRSSLLALGAADGSLLSRIRRIVGLGTERVANERSSPTLIGLLLFGVLCALSMTWCFAMRSGSPKPGDRPNPYLLKTSDGVEVELLGISTHWAQADASREPQPERRGWWQPDGTIMTKPPVSGLSLGVPPKEQANYFNNWPVIAVRIHGDNQLEVENPVIIIDGMREYMARTAGGLNQERFFHETVLSGGPLPGLKSGIVRVAVGNGDYGPWRITKPNGEVETDGVIPDELKSSYEQVAPVEFHEVGDHTRLIYRTQPVNYSATRTRGEAELIDVDGKVVTPESYEVVNGERGTTYSIPLARVSHYRIRLRAFRHWFTFENVSFQPGHKTEVKSSVGKTPELRREPFIATLPNGVRVEFVGLAPMEAEPKTWWKPDGTLLDEVPKHGQETMRVSGHEVRRVLLRVQGDTLNYRDVTAPGMTGVILAEPPGSGGPFIRIGGGYAFPSGQKTGRFEVGIATQPQSPVRYLDAQGRRVTFLRRVNADRRSSGSTLVVDGIDNGRLLGNDNGLGIGLPTARPQREFQVDDTLGSKPTVVEVGEVQTVTDHIAENIEVLSVGIPPLRQPALINGQPVMSPEKEADNKVLQQQTQFTWRAPNVPKLMTVELVLIDVNGKQHQPVASGGGLHERQNRDGTPHWGSTRRFFRFDVPTSRVAGFEYRLRPYQHWVTFENVSLQPGLPTDVKIKVESSPNEKPRRAQEQWSVKGRVVDVDGKPMAGVTVRAATGIGTLLGGGKGETDADGRYEFTFGPGIRFANNDVELQYAMISAHKAGFFEKNLSRQGGLLMARKLPEKLDWGGRKKEDIILSGQPRQLDFVMLSAAKLSGTLIDENEKPLVGYGVSLRGNELPPSTNAIGSTKADESGRFSIGEIPTGVKFQILVQPDKREPPWNAWASGPFEFKTDGGRDDFFIQEATREVAANRFELQLKGSGVNWKEALKIGGSHQKLEPTGNSLTTKSRLHAATIRLTLNPPSKEPPDKATTNKEADAQADRTPRAGRGSPNSALNPTAGLPESGKATNPTNDANGGMQSNPAAGAGDPRRAQDPTPRESTNLEPINGEVIDSVTGKPIDGATVRFRFHKLQRDPSDNDTLVAELVFRNVGRFTFELPDAVKGQTDLFVERTAEHPDYQSRSPSGQGLLSVLKNDPNHARNFIRKVELAPGKVITGRVLDLNGGPAKGVEVHSGPSRQGWQNGFEHKTTTDANGRYRLVVPERNRRGRIYVIPNHAAAVSRAITPEFGEQPVFQLLRGTRLFGRVTDAQGRGIADVVVRANGGERVPWRSTLTDADGWYSLPPCQYGQYVVELFDEGFMPGLPKTGVRLPDVFLPQAVELPKTAPTERQLDFKPTESVRMTARYTTSDDQPVSGRSLSLNGAANKLNWWGRLREVPNQPGHYEARVPRGFEGRINENTDRDNFLRIVRETTDQTAIPERYVTKFDEDGTSFHIRQLKASSVTLRPTFDGQPVKVTGPLSFPQFADPKAAQQVGARAAATQSKQPEPGQLWFDVHPNIDLLLKLEIPGFKPWQHTVRVPEGEDRVIDVPLEANEF